jgi:predicted NAD/FAD-binding protein
MNGSVDTWRRKKVAIVGGGSAGIAALWALNGTYHDVYLYEAADRLGGHTNTVNWKVGRFTAAVDTGFIVMNDDTYRELPACRLPFPVARLLTAL